MKIFKKVIITILVLVAGLVIAYFLGPKPGKLNLKQASYSLPDDLSLVEQYVKEDIKTPGIKENNHSRLIWADSLPKKTEYVLLYLHGFSASPEEGADMALAYAKRFHCNLYIPRLFGHGITEEEPMLNMDASKLFQSADEALSVAKKLGEKIIVMGTSTGATLGMPLAANDPDIHSLIFYSPNIRLADPNAYLLSGPWGLNIAQQVTGKKYHSWEADDYGEKYWTSKYRLEGLVQLQALIDQAMTPEVFAKVKQPIFIGYYFKDEEHQDQTISVSAILETKEWLGTPQDKRRILAFTEAGDHVISNPNSSKEYEAVKAATFSFAEEILGLSPWSAKSDAPSDQEIAQLR